MIQLTQIKLPVHHTESDLSSTVADLLGVNVADLHGLRVKQRAIDARHGKVNFIYTIQVSTLNEALVLQKRGKNGLIEAAPDESYRQMDGVIPEGELNSRTRPVIVGSGPCGLFAGLLLARSGRRPVLLERGKAAGDRARDVMGFWNRGWAFNPESNVQYGEGGAGTFSDGKLYTQIRDREHRIPWLLKEMVAAGAPEDILIKAKPHIGTDRLIKVVRHIREEIISLGGQVRFESRVMDVVIENGAMRAAVLASGECIESDQFLFAIGHSSRDTFEMLHRRGIPFEPKPFSIGVRIEHPQKLIDKMLFGRLAGNPLLGSAPYKFVAHCSNGRAAYSFCMCPGGLVVASSSEPGGLVTNGMSSYARAEANANSGFMVEIKTNDFGSDHPLAGIELQRKFERAAFVLGGGNYQAPTQLLGDFMNDKASKGPGSVPPSYKPGVVWSDLRECLPHQVVTTIKEAVGRVERSLPGFNLHDAVLTGVETRSSSPIRIPRDSKTFQCLGVRHFFPAGEGAGYAGGIISAAADGMRVAEALLRATS